MTTIDHRILIAANPPVVWDYISNLSRNPKWQVDCKSVTFLTGKHDGPGTRWRHVTEAGREHVLEITAWYNGLGYEYVYVDGPGYEENTGRIRLQEIPEGTIVQWTFTYSMPGLFGGMRDSLGMRRQIDKSIADSLRKLYLQIKAHGANQLLEPKSLMRDAPNAEERSQYQPRHPNVPKESEKPDVPLPVKSGVPIIDEPPLTDDDAQSLQPFKPITEHELQAAQPPIIEEPSPEPDDTRPNPVIKHSDEPQASTGAQVGGVARVLSTDKLSTAEVESIPAQSEPDFDFGSDVESAPPPVYIPPVTSSPPVVIAEPPADPIFDTQPRKPIGDISPMFAGMEPEPTLVHPVEERESGAAPVTDERVPEPPVSTEEYITEPTPVVEEEVPEPYAPVVKKVQEEAHFDQPRSALPSTPEPEAVEVVPLKERESPQVMDAPQAIESPKAAESTEMTQISQGLPSKPWEEPTISPNAMMTQQPSSTDTANISIWEVFGVQRPSETQQIKAYVETKLEPLTKANRPDMTPMRLGLRIALRRQRKIIRRIKPTH